MKKLSITIVVVILILVTCIGVYATSYGLFKAEKYVSFKDYRALDAYFQKIGYIDFDNPPKVYVEHLPLNLKDAPVKKRKELFVKILLPMIKKVNSDIENQHEQIITAIKRGDNKALARYMKLYNAKDKDDLLLKVDKIPVDVTLAQAAIESGWGTSRFAIQGNNIFGEWTFEEGTGIVPKKRPDGATYEVKSFPTLLDSLKSYAHNLNTSPFYDDFRKTRAGIKKGSLEENLTAYSTQREEYVKTVRRVIKANNFSSLNDE